MKIKQRIVTVLGVFTALILIAGIWAIAATNYGTESDPLITLSYITDVLTGQVNEKITATVNEKAAGLEVDLNAKVANLEKTYGASASGQGKFSLVSLGAGQVLTGEPGLEIMLRVGSANCTASDSPGLIDTTSTGVLEDGGALVFNHMYMVTISGHGIYAQNDVKVLVRGEYNIA